MRNRLDSEGSNNLLKLLFKNPSEPIAVSRVGLGGETLTTYAVYNNMQVPDQWSHWLHNNAGFYGSKDYRRYADLYHGALQQANVHAYWATGNIFQVAEDFLVPKTVTMIDPSALESFRFSDPWTESLSDKKVLIVHPFKDTLESQLERKDMIWKDQRILGFGQTIVYQSVQSIGGVGPDSDWFASFERMKSDIQKIDFDVALLGCGAYGIPLMGWIKSELGKSSVYVGGGLQLYFGIRGQRWDRSPDVSAMYNESWVRCNEQEKPRHINMAGDEASYF